MSNESLKQRLKQEEELAQWAKEDPSIFRYLAASNTTRDSFMEDFYTRKAIDLTKEKASPVLYSLVMVHLNGKERYGQRDELEDAMLKKYPVTGLLSLVPTSMIMLLEDVSKNFRNRKN